VVIFFIFYQFLQIFSLPLFLLYIIIRKIKNKPIFGKLSERVGFVPKPRSNKNVVWIHAVSVGEALSLQSFIEKIKKENPDTVCYLTVGTPTGKKIAQEKLQADVVSFLPYDFLPLIMLAYKRIKPKRLIIIEAEVWPNLIMLAHFKKIPLSLINARISKRSRDRYHKFKLVLARLLNLFEKIYTQSNHDKHEFEALGVDTDKLEVLGDIKAYNVLEKKRKCAPFESLDPSIHPPSLFELRRTHGAGGLGTNGRLLVGSIHPGELDVYLKLYQALKPKYPNLKLTLAPRHFHWKRELISKTKAMGYSYIVWDNERKPANIDSYDILLVCKLGELFTLYQQATIYFLGGTFVPVGGHNLLEPAVWGKPSIIGPYNHNCRVIAKELIEHTGAITVQSEQKLLEIVTGLFNSPEKIKSMGNNARLWLEREGALVEKKLDSLIASF